MTRRTSWQSTIVGLFIVAAPLIGGCATSLKETPTGPTPVPVSETIRAQLPGDALVVAKSVKQRNGAEYTRVKYLEGESEPAQAIFDAEQQALDVADLPAFKRPLIGNLLRQTLDSKPGQPGYVPDEGEVEVVLVLREEDADGPAREAAGQATFVNGETRDVMLNGQEATVDDLALESEEFLADLAARRAVRQSKRRALLNRLSQADGYLRSPADQAPDAEVTADLRVAMRKGDIEAFAKRYQDSLVAIELYRPSEDSTAGGLTSIGVDPWAHDNCNLGSGVGIYMSESGGRCPTTPHIRNDWYTNLSGGTAGTHANLVGNILRVTAPRAHIYCGAADSTAPNPTSRSPRIFVSTHSFNWYLNDTSYRSEDRNFDNSVYNDRIAVFVSAGNKKSSLTTFTVLSPAKAFNVFSIGNYNDGTDNMNTGSLYVDADPGNEKPDIAAPGTGISTSAGNCSGTSCSAPFAAGFAADLMSHRPYLKGHPELLKAMMLAGASRNIEGSARLSDKDGAGGINYRNTAWNYSFNWWSGGNSSWFDSANEVNVTRNLQAGRRYRIALAWLVPGNYALSNDNVSMDLDLRIYKPDGSYMAGSASYDNPFEIVDFTAPVSGSYRVRIKRWWNSGTGNVIMAVVSQGIF